MTAFIRVFLVPLLWLVVAVGPCLAASAASAASEPGPSPAKATILVMGDSVSAGYGLEPGQGWVQLLQDRLDAVVPGSSVANASVSGETTGGGLARLPDALDRHHPDVVIIELGGNDGLRGYPIARIRGNLTQLVKRSLDAGARVLLVGMYIPPNYGDRYTSAFHATFSEVARQFDVPLVPFLMDGVATDPSLMQADGIHPKAAAQGRLLDNVWPHLAPLLGSSAAAGARDPGVSPPPAAANLQGRGAAVDRVRMSDGDRRDTLQTVRMRRRER